MQIEALVGMATGIAALVSVGVFIYNRGQDAGKIKASVNEIRGIIPQMLEVQKQLAKACTDIANHACDLDRGEERFDAIQQELSELRERIAVLETRVNGLVGKQ